MLPYDCHEGNSALRQGLGGERAEDRKLEEDAKNGIIRPRRPIQGELGVGGQAIGATPGARGAGPGAAGGGEATTAGTLESADATYRTEITTCRRRQRSPGDGEAPDIDNVRPSPSFVLTNMPPFDPSRSGRYETVILSPAFSVVLVHPRRAR